MNGVPCAESIFLATCRLLPGFRDCVTLTRGSITLIVDTPKNMDGAQINSELGGVK